MRALTFFLPVCLLLGQTGSPPSPDDRVDAGDVLEHLTRVIQWYRHVNAIEQSQAIWGDVLLRENLHSAAAKTLRLGFDFARAEATLLNAAGQPSDAAENVGQDLANQNLERAAARASDRVNGIQGRIDALNTTIDKAPSRSLPLLTAQRKQLTAELNLAKEVQRSVQSLVAFHGGMASAKDGAAGLAVKITELERSVPEAAEGQQNGPQNPSARANTAASVFPAPHSESAGIFGLAAELFTLTRARTQLNHALEESDALIKEVDQLRTPLVGELKAAVRRSEDLANAAGGANLEQLALGERQINELAGRVRRLSTATVPLGQQGMAAQTTRSYLAEARNSLDDKYGTTARSLLLRVSLLAIAVAAVLIISGFWRRMTFRYIRDVRRRRQFLVLRRVVVGGLITLVLILSFITEFGSLATYAGLLTAGVAVALQSVILSVVGYFFLIGRYGVRIGDRVTISGVTGNVIDIGLVRIYLLELEAAGPDFRATGRVVGFSNAVLFQSAALFKQMPGTDYVWRSASLTLTPDSDFQLAQNSLTAAVDSVFEHYREHIEKQHAAFERTVDIHVAPPRPECRLRFTDAGLEVSAYYPVPIEQASAIEDRVIRALHDAVASETRLKLASPAVARA